ncbi:hypothetical protein GDO86_017102 [Hymenochirus boettgeri]|uniref:Inducible T-cell costimulator n=1 Tax=Hymenochirus boettgeri TaxID=247094 RepID=A0A8T2ILQ9_9PIPI|nr:hypothetical protein GDO86_017102 [Hymenochirus boettgeri]
MQLPGTELHWGLGRQLLAIDLAGGSRAVLHVFYDFLFYCIAVKSFRSSPKVVIAPRSGKAQLYCEQTFLNVSMFNLTLIRGDKKLEVCKVYTDGQNTRLYTWNKQATCAWEKSNNSGITFTLSNLNVSHTDNYTCEMTVIFPPPLQSYTTSETYIYIHDFQDCQGEPRLIIWVLTGFAAFLFVCFLTTLFLWIQQMCHRKFVSQNYCQNNEFNSEYMPMAPVHPGKRPAMPR